VSLDHIQPEQLRPEFRDGVASLLKLILQKVRVATRIVLGYFHTPTLRPRWRTVRLSGLMVLVCKQRTCTSAVP
jgi:hypothetical protein